MKFKQNLLDNGLNIAIGYYTSNDNLGKSLQNNRDTKGTETLKEIARLKKYCKDSLMTPNETYRYISKSLSDNGYDLGLYQSKSIIKDSCNTLLNVVSLIVEINKSSQGKRDLVIKTTVYDTVTEDLEIKEVEVGNDIHVIEGLNEKIIPADILASSLPNKLKETVVSLLETLEVCKGDTVMEKIQTSVEIGKKALITEMSNKGYRKEIYNIYF